MHARKVVVLLFLLSDVKRTSGATILSNATKVYGMIGEPISISWEIRGQIFKTKETMYEIQMAGRFPYYFLKSGPETGDRSHEFETSVTHNGRIILTTIKSLRKNDGSITLCARIRPRRLCSNKTMIFITERKKPTTISAPSVHKRKTAKGNRVDCKIREKKVEAAGFIPVRESYFYMMLAGCGLGPVYMVLMICCYVHTRVKRRKRKLRRDSRTSLPPIGPPHAYAYPTNARRSVPSNNASPYSLANDHQYEVRIGLDESQTVPSERNTTSDDTFISTNSTPSVETLAEDQRFTMDANPSNPAYSTIPYFEFNKQYQPLVKEDSIRNQYQTLNMVDDPSQQQQQSDIDMISNGNVENFKRGQYQPIIKEDYIRNQYQALNEEGDPSQQQQQQSDIDTISNGNVCERF